MMSKLKIFLRLAAVLLVGFLFVDWLRFMYRYEKNQAAFKAQTAQVMDAAGAVGKTASILEAQEGWDMGTDFAEWLLPPLLLHDGKGNQVTIYQYNCINPPEGGYTPLLYQQLFDPHTAEERRTCQINGILANIYYKDEFAYLWWQPNGQTILVIQYNPLTAAEEDILFIAENMRAYPANQ